MANRNPRAAKRWALQHRGPTPPQIQALFWLAWSTRPNGWRNPISDERPKEVSHYALAKCAFHGWSRRGPDESYRLTPAGVQVLEGLPQ